MISCGSIEAYYENKWINSKFALINFSLLATNYIFIVTNSFSSLAILHTPPLIKSEANAS